MTFVEAVVNAVKTYDLDGRSSVLVIRFVRLIHCSF